MRAFVSNLVRSFWRPVSSALKLPTGSWRLQKSRIKNRESRIKPALVFLFAALILNSFFLILSSPTQAATGINQQINFQARLFTATGSVIPDGNYNLEFKIYQDGTGCVSTGSSPCGGTLKWTEDWLNNNTQSVVVRNGYFSVQLGSITSLSTVDFNQSVNWLSLNVGNTNATCTPFSSCSGDGEMLPFQRFGANAYSFNSDRLGGLQSSAFGQLSATQTYTGANTLQPTTDVTGLTVKQNSTGAPTADILNVQTANATSIIRVTSPAINEAAVTIASVGATRDLTLSSGSGTLQVTSDLNLASGKVYKVNSTSGATTTCSGGNVLQNQTVLGGITTGGTCAASGGGTVTDLQTAYDGSSSPASILLATGKNLVVTSPDVATDPNILFNLQCTTCSASGGRFAVQSGGVDVATINPNGGAATFKTTANSATAFQIQNQSGNNVLSVDTSAGTANLGKGSSVNGALVINNSTNGNNITIQSGVTSASYSLTLPTAVGALDNCLRTNASGVLSWTACGAASGTLQGAYDASVAPASITTANDKNIVFTAADTANDSGIIFNLQCSTCTSGTNSNGGQFQIQAAGTNVFTVAPSGSTGVATLTGTLLQKSSSATAFVLQNTSSENSLVFDGSTKHLKIFENVATPSRYADIFYDNTNSEAVFAASSGVTRIGSGSGNVTIPLTGQTDVLNFTKTYTAAAPYSQSEFNITRNVTGGANALTGNVAKIEDLSTFSGGSSAPNVLYVNQNNTSATGNLILAQTGGGANDKFKVDTTGTVTIAAGQSYTGVGALSLTSAAASTLTLDSGTTGALNIGAGANAKAITVGNATGATSLTLQAGTGGLAIKPITANTTALTIQDSAAAKYLIVDTTNARLQVGDTAADGTGVLLVLDTKNSAGDPTGVNGAMYYNSNTNTFRCYENSLWKDCLSHHIVVLGADITSAASTAFQDVTGLSFAVTSGQTYRFHAQLLHSASVATIGTAWAVSGPATPTVVGYVSNIDAGAAATIICRANAYDTCAQSTASTNTSGNVSTIDGFITPSANGTFIVRFHPETATSGGTVVKTGSTLEWW